MPVGGKNKGRLKNSVTGFSDDLGWVLGFNYRVRTAHTRFWFGRLDTSIQSTIAVQVAKILIINYLMKTRYLYL